MFAKPELDGCGDSIQWDSQREPLVCVHYEMMDVE